jgi:hypothetical protein
LILAVAHGTTFAKGQRSMEEKQSNRVEIVTQTALAIAIFMAILLCAGCTTQSQSSPPETATEQLLLSTAGDRALAKASVHFLSGQHVYADFTYFDAYHKEYAEGLIRDALSRAGALLVPDAKSADIIVEARAGAYSIDTNSTFFGVPSIPIPIPTTSAIPLTPSVPFYSKAEQLSYAKIALLAYSRKTGAHIYSSGSLDGRAYDTYRTLLFISWWSSNIPEKNSEKKKEKFINWQPQYDLQNLPAATSH